MEQLILSAGVDSTGHSEMPWLQRLLSVMTTYVVDAVCRTLVTDDEQTFCRASMA